MKCEQGPLTLNKTHKPINWPAILSMIREYQKLVMYSNIYQTISICSEALTELPLFHVADFSLQDPWSGSVDL